MESKIKELLHQYEMDSNYPKLRTALLSLSLPPSKEVVLPDCDGLCGW
jgi:hypothetical protein